MNTELVSVNFAATELKALRPGTPFRFASTADEPGQGAQLWICTDAGIVRLWDGRHEYNLDRPTSGIAVIPVRAYVVELVPQGRARLNDEHGPRQEETE